MLLPWPSGSVSRSVRANQMRSGDLVGRVGTEQERVVRQMVYIICVHVHIISKAVTANGLFGPGQAGTAVTRGPRGSLAFEVCLADSTTSPTAFDWACPSGSQTSSSTCLPCPFLPCCLLRYLRHSPSVYTPL